MNREDTELNLIYGLCVGYDTIFIKRSEAPVTYVVAKEWSPVTIRVLFSYLHTIA